MFSIFKRPRRKRTGNRGKLMGQKPPLKPKEIWSIRVRLQMSRRRRDLALFNLALANVRFQAKVESINSGA